MAKLTTAQLRALRLILAQGGLEQGRQGHRGRQDANSIHATVANALVREGLARWENSPVRPTPTPTPTPTPRPPARRHAQLRRWLERERRLHLLTDEGSRCGLSMDRLYEVLNTAPDPERVAPCRKCWPASR